MSQIVYSWTAKSHKSLINNNTDNYSIKSDCPYMDRFCHILGTTFGMDFLKSPSVDLSSISKIGIELELS